MMHNKHKRQCHRASGPSLFKVRKIMCYVTFLDDCDLQYIKTLQSVVYTRLTRRHSDTQGRKQGVSTSVSE